MTGDAEMIIGCGDGGSCAIVGNAEHLLGQGLGEYIDEHDAVLRINDGPQGSPHDVGEKTTHRIYNRNKSIKMCCNEQAAAALAPGTMILLWHPTDQAELLDACESKAPHVKTYAISRAMIRVRVEFVHRPGVQQLSALKAEPVWSAKLVLNAAPAPAPHYHQQLQHCKVGVGEAHSTDPYKTETR